jgi:hypothetical protein
MTSVALFNNKGGVGKTTLTYHLAHMLQRLGHRVLAVDLDPQANLTAQFLPEEAIASLWNETPVWPEPGKSPWLMEAIKENKGTVATAVEPIRQELGDISPLSPLVITDNLWLLAGDLELSRFEDKLSESWSKCFNGHEPSLRATTAFHRIIENARASVDAEFVLIDVGPNLGAINRAALLSLREWRSAWQDSVLPRVPDSIAAPRGTMKPLGYVIMQPIMRLDRPVQAYRRWLDRIPAAYASAVVGELGSEAGKSYEVATLKNYQSLMPLAHDARKPMFDLLTADGAIGSTQTYVKKCYQDFQSLARTLLERLDTI